MLLLFILVHKRSFANISALKRGTEPLTSEKILYWSGFREMKGGVNGEWKNTRRGDQVPCPQVTSWATLPSSALGVSHPCGHGVFQIDQQLPEQIPLLGSGLPVVISDLDMLIRHRGT